MYLKVFSTIYPLCIGYVSFINHNSIQLRPISPRDCHMACCRYCKAKHKCPQQIVFLFLKSFQVRYLIKKLLFSNKIIYLNIYIYIYTRVCVCNFFIWLKKEKEKGQRSYWIGIEARVETNWEGPINEEGQGLGMQSWLGLKIGLHL